MCVVCVESACKVKEEDLGEQVPVLFEDTHCNGVAATLSITSRKARLRRASLLWRPHDSTSTTATRHQSGKARVCDDSVLMSSGGMHA